MMASQPAGLTGSANRKVPTMAARIASLRT
jgi:hypothetical protein